MPALSASVISHVIHDKSSGQSFPLPALNTGTFPLTHVRSSKAIPRNALPDKDQNYYFL